MTSTNSAPINVQNAKKVIVSLPFGTNNALTDGATENYDDTLDDTVKGALFSKADLVINGEGGLSIYANHADGINGRDDVKILGGSIDVTAADDGIVGKDMVAIETAVMKIDAANDAIKSTNDTDTKKGIIVIAGGTYTLTAGHDGIQAETYLYIEGGDFTIAAGGGSAAATVANGFDEMAQGDVYKRQLQR